MERRKQGIIIARAVFGNSNNLITNKQCNLGAKKQALK